MTFEELQEKVGMQDRDDWNQHANGGGWVHKSAKVDKSAYVGGRAIVWGQVSGDAWVSGNARVSGDAQVYGNARVSGDAWVSGNAQVYGNVRVSGDAWVSGNARVYGDAWVSGNARVYGDAWVSGDAWEKPTLYVLDSRGHGCTNCKHGWLKIGCEEHAFEDWVERFDGIARKHNLTDIEKKEYRAIVDLFCAIGK